MAETAAFQSRICRLVGRKPSRLMLLALLCLALFVRGRIVAKIDTNGLFADPDGYSAIAANLVRSGSFSLGAHPIAPDLPLATATRPPLYPLVLAALSLASEGPFLFIALHVVLGVATVVAAWHLARLWSLPPGAALIAAGFVMIDPILLAYSAQVMTETLATFLATMALIAVTQAAARPSFAWTIAAGTLLGLCVLCRPEFLVWAVMIVMLFPFTALGARRWWRGAACAAVIAAGLAPWAIRNQREFGSPVVTTTHGGYTLLLANNPSFYEYARSGPWDSTWNGDEVYLECGSIRQRSLHTLAPPPRYRVRADEVAADREAYRRAFKNIRAQPGLFAWSSLVRVGRLWNVLPHQTSADESPTRRGLRWAVAVWYAFELALAAAGAWLLRKKLLAQPWLWGTLLVLSITAVHTVYWTDMRMRAPLTAVVALAAAQGLVSLACGKQSASALNPPA